MSEAVLGEVANFVDSLQLREDLHFSETDIDGASIEQASMFAYYAELAMKAQIQADKFKNRVELLESHIAQELRDDAIETGKKVTEASIKQSISGDRRYIKAQLDSSKAKAQFDFTKNALEAFKQRKDMIIQIAVNRRTERESKVLIRETSTATGISEQAISGARR